MAKKTTKYFLNLEKQNQTSNIIKELKTSKGDMIYTTNSIIGEMINYYTNLFKTTNIPTDKILTYLDNIEVPMLNERDKLMLDEFPTFEECKNAVLDMKGEKSPGLDGIPVNSTNVFGTLLDQFSTPHLKKFLNKKRCLNLKGSL